MTKPFIRSPYNYDSAAVSDETALHCTDVSKTSQHHAHEADINNIVESFIRSPEELLAGMRLAPQPTEIDITFAPKSYHEALNAINTAQTSFNKLHPKIRSRFNNNPGEMLEFLSDNSNYAEAVALGLAIPSGRDGSAVAETIPAAPTAAKGTGDSVP